MTGTVRSTIVETLTPKFNIFSGMMPVRIAEECADDIIKALGTDPQLLLTMIIGLVRDKLDDPHAAAVEATASFRMTARLIYQFALHDVAKMLEESMSNMDGLHQSRERHIYGEIKQFVENMEVPDGFQ